MGNKYFKLIRNPDRWMGIWRIEYGIPGFHRKSNFVSIVCASKVYCKDRQVSCFSHHITQPSNNFSIQFIRYEETNSHSFHISLHRRYRNQTTTIIIITTIITTPSPFPFPQRFYFSLRFIIPERAY